MPILEDLLQRDLDLVICGTAVGDESARSGAYYADPRNKFWKTLHGVGLTDRQLSPQEWKLLASYRIGLTDLAKEVYGVDDQVKKEDIDRARLLVSIEHYQPRYLCFSSGEAARAFFGKSEVNYGLQATVIGNTGLFVAPSTSGTNSSWWSHNHERWWRELAVLVKSTEEKPREALR